MTRTMISYLFGQFLLSCLIELLDADGNHRMGLLPLQLSGDLVDSVAWLLLDKLCEGTEFLVRAIFLSVVDCRNKSQVQFLNRIYMGQIYYTKSIFYLFFGGSNLGKDQPNFHDDLSWEFFFLWVS